MHLRFAICPILLLLTGLQLLFAADIDKGVLNLEILIESGNSIRVQGNSTVQITEQSSPISREILAPFVIQTIDTEKHNVYGLLNRIVLLQPDYIDDETSNVRTTFKWSEGQLVLLHERLIYEDIHFETMAEAEDYARSTGSPLSKIHTIPMTGTMVKITTSRAEILYFEAPLLISSSKDITLNNSPLQYNGNFTIKAKDNQLIICHKLPLEDYIAGVIQNEIGNTAPLDALRAQAVAARTHAISLLLSNRHREDGYDLCNTTHCQVYKGKHLLNQNVLTAVQDTHNCVLVFQTQLAETPYHSSCGGKTDSSQNIWKGKPFSYLMGVSVYAEADSIDLKTEDGARTWIDTNLSVEGMSNWEKLSVAWTQKFRCSQLGKNAHIDRITTIEIVKRGFSGRILAVKFNDSLLVEGEYKIRAIFGNTPSSFFYLEGIFDLNKAGNPVFRVNDELILHGKGSGHGVGLCQVSTLQMARNGDSWRYILSFFYPGTDVIDNWLRNINE